MSRASRVTHIRPSNEPMPDRARVFSAGSLASREFLPVERDGVDLEPVHLIQVTHPLALETSDPDPFLKGFLCGDLRARSLAKTEKVWSDIIIESCEHDTTVLRSFAQRSIDLMLPRLYTCQFETVGPILKRLALSKLNDTTLTFEFAFEHVVMYEPKALLEELRQLSHSSVSIGPLGDRWSKLAFIQAFQLQANTKMEDALFYAFDPESESILAGVMDGHGGPHAVRVLGTWLPRLLQIRLAWLKRFDVLTPSTVASALEGAFTECDARWRSCLENKRTPSALVPKSESDEQEPESKRARPSEPASLSKESAELLSIQGSCALVCVVQRDWLVLGHVGDCRALLLSIDKLSPSTVTFEWLNEQHLPESAQEFAQVAERTRGRDKVPLRPALQTLQAIIKEKNPFQEPLSLDSYYTMCQTGDQTKPFDSLSASLDHLSEQARVPSDIVKRQVQRVAGNLMVTRALGDAYLKYPSLSTPPFSRGAPYITCQPTITCLERRDDASDIVVLASDGIWDIVDPADFVDCLQHANETGKDLHGLVVEHMCERLFDAHGLSFERIVDMPHGPQRRDIHDDMTLIIMYLGYVPKCLAQGRLIPKWNP